MTTSGTTNSVFKFPLLLITVISTSDTSCENFVAWVFFYHKVCKSGTSSDSSSGCNRMSKNESSYKVLVVAVDVLLIK